MNKFIPQIIDEAKVELLKNGFVKQKTFFVRKGVLIPPPPTGMFDRLDEIFGIGRNSEENKERDVYITGLFAHLFNADSVVMVWDAAFRVGNKIPADATETPLSYPRSMRTEAIMILEFFVPDFKCEIQVIPYRGGEGRPVEFVELKGKIVGTRDYWMSAEMKRVYELARKKIIL